VCGCGVGGDGPGTAVDDEDGVVSGGGSHSRQITGVRGQVSGEGGRWAVDGVG
jgi:hypothetical protein